MSKRAFVVTGLGYGDEGKGKVVHWLTAIHKAHTVVRTGGPQAFHRVVTSSGQEHVHAQFGSGTLAGAATHLSKNMVIDPYAILAEGKVLDLDFGIGSIFERLTIHEDALVITPFQAIANRLRELARGASKRGSVGVGVGETITDAQALRGDVIRAKDLGKPYLFDRLLALQERKINELKEAIELIDGLPDDVRVRARLELTNLKSSGTVEWAIGWFAELASKTNIVDTDYVAEKILGREGTVIFEGSQGVLLDPLYGFYPYTTKVRTISGPTLSLIKECDYDGEVTSLGVLRAYHTRHGGGPFVAECPELTKQLPDATNGNHSWQGNFRVGCFDVVVAKYAVDACGDTLDGLVITCVDRIAPLGEWKVCQSYQDGERTIGSIPVSHKIGDKQIRNQEEIGRLLSRCQPNVDVLKITDPLFIGFQFIRDELNIPVYAVSTGPTEKDLIEPEYQIDLGFLQ
ncbi:MAG: adenylosuccinate synthetase [Deltaproteobacteria bacterium]|nr:adenylosuccinate synthetase [Deltaproteobacteria bacterium]